jgi:hypothetical protein
VHEHGNQQWLASNDAIFDGAQWKLSHPWSICTALHFFLVGGRVHGKYLVKSSRLRCRRTRQFRPTGSMTFSMRAMLVGGD